jgi:secreted PhoX family phosphatase
VRSSTTGLSNPKEPHAHQRPTVHRAGLRQTDDLDTNTSANPHLGSVLERGLTRRGVLRGGLGGAMAALFAPMALTACGGGSDAPAVPGPTTPTETLLGFTAVAKTLADTNTVPVGCTARVILPCGDPLATGACPRTRTTAPTPTARSAWVTATTASSTSA